MRKTHVRGAVVARAYVYWFSEPRPILLELNNHFIDFKCAVGEFIKLILL